jgi:hypothetical protein
MATLSARPRFVGINTTEEPSELGVSQASDALNLDFCRGTLKKRPGYSQIEDSGASAVQGIFDFRRNSGAVDTIVKAGDTLYKWNGSVLSSLTGGGSLSTELADFAVYGDRCYMVDGTNLKVNDGTTAYDAQISRPSAPSIATTAGSATLSGEYDYKITYYSSTWGQESPASDASSVLEVDSQDVRITFPAASGDTRVTDFRVYRRKVSRNEQLWYLVTTLDETTYASTTWDDSTIDQNISNTEIAPLSYSASLPGFRYCAIHSGVMFLAGDDADLYFTLPEQPWSVSNYTPVGGEGEFGKITGLVSFKGLLFIFKEDSIWTCSGLTAETFSFSVVLSGIGCHAGHSIVTTENLIYFLGEDGFYAFDGSDAVKISDARDTEVQGRNRSRDVYVSGADYEELEAIVWTYSSGGSAANDKVEVFFYGNTRKTEGDQSWCPWQFDANVTYLARVTTDATTRDRKLWYGFVNGVIGEAGGTTDNSTAIECYWRTGKWDGGVPMRIKVWGRFTLETDPQAAQQYVALRYYRDSDTSFEVFGEPDSTEAIHQCRIADSSRDLRIEIYETSSVGFEAIGFEIEARLGGLA